MNLMFNLEYKNYFSENVPMGMNKKELEIIFQQMQCEEEK